MKPNALFMEQVKIVPAYTYNTQGGARTSDRVSMENYNNALILVQSYQAANSAVAITVDAFTAATSGSTSAGITFNTWWELEDCVVGALTSDTWTRSSAAAASVTTTTSATGTSYYAIELNADDLTISGVNYPWFAVQVASGSASNILSIIVFLYNPRYSQNALPTAIA